MPNCVVCNHEFRLPKSDKKIQNLIHSFSDFESEEFNYMCEDCYEHRSNIEYRYEEGIILCAKSTCGREALSFSKFCFLCDDEI